MDRRNVALNCKSAKFVRYFGHKVTRRSLSPLHTQAIHKPTQDDRVIDAVVGIVERGTRKVADCVSVTRRGARE